MIDFLKDGLQEELKYFSKMLDKKLNLHQIKELCEFSFFLEEIQTNTVLKNEDRVILSRFIKNIAKKIYVYDKIFYFHSLYKLPQEYFGADAGKVGRATYIANIDISIMRLRMREGMVLGCSEDSYFFSRGDSGLVRATNNLLNHSDDEEVLNPAFYTVLNYFQAIIEYLDTNPKLYLEEASELVGKCLELIKKFVSKRVMTKHLKKNSQLNLFLLSLITKYETLSNEKIDFIDKTIGDLSDLTAVTKKIWAYFSLTIIDFEVFKETFYDDFYDSFIINYDKLNKIERSILLRSCLLFTSSEEVLDFTSIKIPICEIFEYNEWFSMENYFNGYGKHASTQITDQEKQKVLSYNDAELRAAVAQTIINIDKTVVERETKKPHGVFEISDMELPIRRGSPVQTYYLCMPFKSGQEIKNKVTEDVSYQVYRPFANFGTKAIVVFVSPREGTEPFYNAIKRASANLNWTIHTLTGDNLVKLLKYNNIIRV